MEVFEGGSRYRGIKPAIENLSEIVYSDRCRDVVCRFVASLLRVPLVNREDGLDGRLAASAHMGLLADAG